MRNKNLFLSCAIIIFIASGCAYYPRLTDVPLIRHKGDTRLEGGITVAYPSFHATVSHGISEKMAFQVAGKKNFVEDGYYAQAAVGTYKNLPDRKVLEFYGGVGYGHGVGHNGGTVSGSYQVIFLQMNGGYIDRKFSYKIPPLWTVQVEYGFGLKAGFIMAQMHDDNYFGSYFYHEMPYEGPDLSMQNILFEPMWFMRFGKDRLKLQMALGLAGVYSISHRSFPFFPVNVGIGFSYSL